MKNAVLFPGQGAQRVGMAVDFAERHPRAREVLREADDVLGFHLTRLLSEGPKEALTPTEICQPAIYAASAAIISVLEDLGIVDRRNVVAAAGLSLGEYTALWWAGAFSFADGLRLVARRGTLMQEASDAAPSGMISLLGATMEQARAVAKDAAECDVLVLANVLGPGQIVLSGARAALDRVPAAAKAHGVKRAIPLEVAGAFHSPLMESAAVQLKVALAEVRLSDPGVPVIGNVSGKPMTTAAEIRTQLGAQVTMPVLWQQSMEHLAAEGVQRAVEPGPGKVLSGLLRKIAPDIAAVNFDAVADLDRSEGESHGP